MLHFPESNSHQAPEPTPDDDEQYRYATSLVARLRWVWMDIRQEEDLTGHQGCFGISGVGRGNVKCMSTLTQDRAVEETNLWGDGLVCP